MDGVQSFACPDWRDKLARGETPIPALDFDPIEAEVAVGFFNKLRVPDIPGQPTMGEVGGEWFRDIIRAAFGCISYRPDPLQPDATEMVRNVGEIFNLVPKKNSKTTNAAALGIIALLMNRRPNIDGVIIGPTQEVAEKCFAQASAMIEADPYLVRRFKVIDHKKTIIDQHIDERTGVRMNAKLKIKSFDPKVVTGSIPAFAILDELHVMAESSHAARVIGQIRGGMITNSESLLIFITTQSETPPSGVFKSELEYARGVRDGRITSGVRMLPVLYEFPEEIQGGEDKPWRDVKLWPMVLPNLNRSVTLARLVPDYQQAVDKGIEEEARWASQHLNIEIGLGLKSSSWIGAHHWPGAGDKTLTLDELMRRCEVATIGIDGGGLDDLFGFAAIGRERDTKKWLHWGRAWAHPEVLTQRKEIAPRLLDFEKDGDLAICKDSTQDIREVADICEQFFLAGLLPEKWGIGLDPYAVGALVDELAARGMEGQLLEAVGQGTRLSPAMWTLERKLKDKTFLHGARPMMSWVLGNAKVEQRGNAVMITKEAAGKAKIDPLVAAFNAAMLMQRNPQARGHIGEFLSGAVMVMR